jgi:hypothetical protein
VKANISRHTILAASCAGILGLAALPAVGWTPNPSNPVPWPDHSKPVWVLVDLEDQHYAHVHITPQGSEAVITCENGKPGSSHRGLYTVEYLAGDQVLADTVAECDLERSGGLFTPHQKKTFPISVGRLPEVIDQVTAIRMHAESTRKVSQPTWATSPPRVNPPAAPVIRFKF